MDVYAAIPRIFLALALGGLVGLEREFTQKSAGLRTHILVTLGATIFTWVSLSDFFHGLGPGSLQTMNNLPFRQDPSRVAAQIVTGIGFIGGGAVLRYGTTVRGLTTAASLWTMASIGMLVGIGQYKLAIIATLLTFLVLFTIGKVERQFFSKAGRSLNRLRIHILTEASHAPTAQAWVEEGYAPQILEARTKADTQTQRVELDYILHLEPGRMDLNQVSRELCQLAGVHNTTVKSYYEQEDLS